MAERVNFHSLAVEPRKRHTRTFPEPRLPGGEFTLTLMEPDALTDYAASEISGELIKRYIEGDDQLGMPPQPFMVGKEARPVSVGLCDDVGLMVALQPEDWADRYHPEEMVMMALKLRSLWRQVKAWTRDLYQATEASLPNASRGDEVGSSPRPSTAEPSTRELSATSA